MNQIEIEVKVLLQSEANAEKFMSTLRSRWEVKMIGKNSQLNHYFNGGDFSQMVEQFREVLSEGDLAKLEHIIQIGKSFSVRTRQADERVIFVIKASIDETNSINGTWRIEFEADVSMSIDDLDARLLASGCTYASKWSRYREEYSYKDYTICLDKNSGYGYLVEFERVVSDSSELDTIKAEIRSEIESLGFEELSQDRVNRMYEFYCQHWPEYYGASEFKYFTVE